MKRKKKSNKRIIIYPTIYFYSGKTGLTCFLNSIFVNTDDNKRFTFCKTFYDRKLQIIKFEFFKEYVNNSRKLNLMSTNRFGISIVNMIDIVGEYIDNKKIYRLCQDLENKNIWYVSLTNKSNVFIVIDNTKTEFELFPGKVRVTGGGAPHVTFCQPSSVYTSYIFMRIPKVTQQLFPISSDIHLKLDWDEDLDKVILRFGKEGRKITIHKTIGHGTYNLIKEEWMFIKDVYNLPDKEDKRWTFNITVHPHEKDTFILDSTMGQKCMFQHIEKDFN